MEFELQRFYIFLSIFTVILSIAYYYATYRLTSPFALDSTHKIILWSVVGILVLLTPGAYLLSLFYRETAWQKVWSYTAFTSLGFFTLLLSFVVFQDLGRLAWKGWVHLADILQLNARTQEQSIPNPSIGFSFFASEANPSFSMSRKDLLEKIGSVLVLALTGGLTAYGFYQAHRGPKIKEVRLRFPNLPEGLHGFKIAQLSDIHIGPTIKKGFLEDVVQRTNTLEADLVAVTGDLVDGTVNLLREHVEPLSSLNSKYGTYFVTGNHEYYSGAISWVRELENLGLNVLLNQNRIIEHNGARLAVAGVTDYKAHTIIPAHRSDPFQAATGTHNADFKMLLAHQPNSVFEAAKAGFHLQLSGHTHGGQYFPGNLLVYLAQKFVAGLHYWEGTSLYVSRGTGYWGPPLRIGAPSEITLLVLEKSES
ncbi:phosphohydrolase [Leptospira perolatii]|uniref:Phosphohydrolase n=1 Tax=Leptospira perolatii TaxID=2023191 RepID=A0A2M9ZK91_9LEPT|nr:metallophosphoesterase [Leptospira perolatii]PJZ69323.1 phosphohydrolase [Leptospira perolatii]PJZ72458.1 phosphohydrolase [Leptospira perolatii]